MPHPAARVLGLLELLQAHHVLGGRELASRLGVDERTVRRYARTLAELGVPVTAARGRYGGYRLAPAFKLPPLMFTDDEAVAVLLGLLAADRIGLATDRPASGTALAKLRRVLPSGLADRVGAVEESLGFSLSRPARAAGPDAGVLLALGTAVAGRCRVEIGYTAWSGAASRRELDPYGLVFHSGRWYLTGYDHRRGEVRNFRLDRISDVTPVPGSGFEVPPDFDPVATVTRGLASVPYTHEVEVVLEAPLDQVRARLPRAVGTLRAGAGDRESTVLTCRAESLDGMAQLLGGLPWAYTIIRPDELRAALLAHAGRIAANAARVPDPDPGSDPVTAAADGGADSAGAATTLARDG
ncbi:helix-turn-helix transcriptional regulator [Rugosimonospora africana]|uniref:Transcriptional regulator n=1 Tax=Rugosimonospora africana TaxID=556532 RepID=A0A8J3QWF3_9ACTN|nr:YafY family protein [Rugosimonospora africana]GIH17342.1 transcriptional regulator [Rugosimonospora africana]